MSVIVDTNPLLNASGLPKFNAIEAGDFEPAVDFVLAEYRATVARLIEALDADHEQCTFATFIRPLEEARYRLARVWNLVVHLKSVMGTESIRDAFDACVPKMSKLQTELGQHEGLLRAFQLIKRREYDQLDTASRMLIDVTLRDFRLGGIDLDDENRKRFGEITERLDLSQSAFDNRVTDATRAWYLHRVDPEAFAGVPESAMAFARQSAEEKLLPGWLFTLDQPSYLAIMTHADDRALRLEMYWAYNTRASDQGPTAGRFDNTSTMAEIMNLRQELAHGVLGFKDCLDFSLQRKMMNEEEVFSLLDQVAEKAHPAALLELEALERFAREECGFKEEIQQWDLRYLTEKYVRHHFKLSQEELRPYFPVWRVMEGIFAIVERLYGIKIHEHGGASVWHSDIRLFEIYDREGLIRGMFFVDIYPRVGKKNGAWYQPLFPRYRAADGVRVPVGCLACNATPPLGGAPGLLTHQEAQYLFHEVGHAMNDLLTLVDFPTLAGLNNVPWDAVELPSEIMEEWCWHPDALKLISGHYVTGEPLDQALLDKLLAARKFQYGGLSIVRQLEFMFFDLNLHTRLGSFDGTTIQTAMDEARARVAVVKYPEFNRFAHSFSHVFEGSYAAGYWTYLAALVLAADGFSEFEENGIFDAGTGARFMRLLENAGSRDFMELYIQFRGRKPNSAAMLKQFGLDR